jgi:hypothetical protein
MEVTQKQLIVLLREGRAPLKARAAIARAALPLQPGPLLESLDILADDPEPAIQAAAQASLERLPETLLMGVVSSTRLAPELLDRLARRFRGNGAVAGAIAGNSAADDATVAFLATLPHPTVLEIIGRDQVRLERSPETIAALLANTETPATIKRLCGEPLLHSAISPPPGAAKAGPGEDDAAFEPVLVDEEADGAPEQPPAVEADGAPSARQISIFALLKQMTMGQKVALAVKGNRDVRNLLIRESNKMLCLKVLENPRIGDTDVEAYAKSTNIPEEVLRGIALRKEWCKKYSIVKALVLNPKAPLGVTLDFIKRLNLKDLEQLTKNRNVPETLRSTARKMVELKSRANH